MLTGISSESSVMWRSPWPVRQRRTEYSTGPERVSPFGAMLWIPFVWRSRILLVSLPLQAYTTYRTMSRGKARSATHERALDVFEHALGLLGIIANLVHALERHSRSNLLRDEGLLHEGKEGQPFKCRRFDPFAGFPSAEDLRRSVQLRGPRRI